MWNDVKQHPMFCPTHSYENEFDFDVLIKGIVLMRIPLKNSIFYCVGYVGEDMWLKDSTGDDIGYPVNDVTHWMGIPDWPQSP